MPRKQPLGRKYKKGRQGSDAKPKRALPVVADEAMPPAPRAALATDQTRRLMNRLTDEVVEDLIDYAFDRAWSDRCIDLDLCELWLDRALAQARAANREHNDWLKAHQEYWDADLAPDEVDRNLELECEELEAACSFARVDVMDHVKKWEETHLLWGEPLRCPICKCTMPCQCDPESDYLSD